MEQDLVAVSVKDYGRGKRRSHVISPIKSDQSANANTTPTKKRPSKKTRFTDSALLINPSSPHGSSGLTPVIGRASLDTPRRSSFPDEIQFTPFRQALDNRTKRRIGRHRLSEEQNAWAADRKTRKDLLHQIEAKDAELQRLRQQVEENATLRENNTDATDDQVDETEAELEQLRQSFRTESNKNDCAKPAGDLNNYYPRERRNSNDTICIFEDDDILVDAPTDGTDEEDVFNMGLGIESSRQVKKELLRLARQPTPNSSQIHFQDSPARQRRQSPVPPATPSSLYHELSKQLKATTNRAEDAELALKGLDMEIRALGFSSSDAASNDLVTDIVSYFRQARMDLERVIPGETVASLTDHAQLLPELVSKLKLLAHKVQDREAELKSMRDQQRSLKGNFEHAIVAAEKANARLKDLETTIDTNAEDMLELRIKAQSREKELLEKESTVQSLITALEKYRSDVSRLENLITTIEFEHKLAQQQTNADYSQQVSDLDAKVAAEEHGRRTAEHSAVARLYKIHDLEKQLEAALNTSNESEKKVTDLQNRLQSLTDAHSEQLGSVNARISSLAIALSSANAEVDKLRTTNTRLEDRYRNEIEYASRTVDQFQTEMIRYVTKTSEGRKSYLRGAKVRLGNWEIESDGIGSDTAEPMTPASMVRFVDVNENSKDAGAESGSESLPGSIEMSRGRRRYLAAVKGEHGLGIRTGKSRTKKGGRRSYDSGIGMDSLSEIDESGDADVEGDEDVGVEGLITPELSSEADIDIDNEFHVGN